MMGGKERKDAAIWQQTKALMYRNFLIKRRNKDQTLEELLLPLLLVFALVCLSIFVPPQWYVKTYTSEPEVLDDYAPKIRHKLGYTPVNIRTKKIMEEVKELMEVILQGFDDEQAMEQVCCSYGSEPFVGVFFTDSLSYQLRYPYNKVPRTTEKIDYIDEKASCRLLTGSLHQLEECPGAMYLLSGFATIQKNIDIAIIKTQTNYSVWKDMESLQVQMMGLPSHVGADIFSHLVTSLYFVIAFVPFVNFLLINLVIEKKEVKEVMKVMGLYDSAFWLSWGLLYLVLIFILSLVMAIIATETSLFPRSSIIIIFPLLFLFGISIIPFSFLLTPLFKNQKIAGLVGSLMLMGFGLFSLPTVLVRDFPVSAVWGLCLFSPSALAIGIAQVVLLEATGDGAQPSNLSANPYPLYIPLIMLVLDSLLYLLIAAYLDQVLPGEFGQHQPFFYFLRPSYWFHRRKHYDQIDAVSEGEPSHTTGFSKVVEAVPAELKGKEAIRLNGVRKLYKEKEEKVEALKGLTFDVYQDQITALLGHSGTGKTTLINILSGLCPLSEGSATVFGYRVSELDELVEIRKMIGVCPQFDVLFYSLTVKEHLKILAMIKGIPSQEINNEVLGVLKELDLEAVMDVRAEKLSGGQKRKLSLGMAILGDPKVLLLDEPTAGMDPCSRQQVWTLLKKRKAGRVILLTTHFMDEADILADRKAVISQGQLKCVGSSLFLKAKFGVGYHLRMSVKESCDSDHVTSLVKRYIPNARLSQVHDLELAYTLPLEDVNKFADLFVDLDHHMDLGIDSYGVSMTSLEEVFLKLEAESEIDQTDYSVFTRDPTPDGIANEEDFDAFDCIDHQLLTFPENNSSVLTGTPLWWQQFRTIVWLRFMNLSRERSALLCNLHYWILISMVVMTALLNGTLSRKDVAVELSPELILLHRGAKQVKYTTSLLLRNSTGSNIDKLIHGLEAQNVEVQLFGDTELMDVAPHNAALNVSLSEEQYLFTAVFNSTVIHSLPVLLNIISNALIISINGSGRIRAWSKPFHLTVTDADFREHVYMALAVLGLLAAALPGCYTMDNARDREIKSRSQLRLSGLFPSAYWCGYALVDIPVYFVIVAVMLGCVIAFNTTSLLHVGAGISMMLCLIGWVPAMMLFSYAYSFRFDRMQSSRDFFLISSLLINIFSIVLILLIWLILKETAATIVHCILSLLIPPYVFTGCLCYTAKIFLDHMDDPILTVGTYLEWRNNILITIIAPYIQCVILLFVLRQLEKTYGGKSIRPDKYCRILPSKSKFKINTEEPENEDDDVKIERARVKEAVTCQSCEEKPVIVVSSLRKVYTGKSRMCKWFSKKKKKNTVATKNVSFCVRKGEVLGLLGPNGAGKSTTISMITGDLEPSAGQVLMGDYSSEFSQKKSPVETLGYCAQVNPLWPKISVEEHLEIYAAIKGLSKEDAKDAIKRIVKALELKEHLQKPTKKVSTGIKRKLCFALCMLGNPHIVLMDEPSTGMDPKAKQFMWRAIRAAFKDRQRGAILTTHYMEEAEALCDRVAIMVSGQLRCIGTIQHLKSKYGGGYTLEMKLKDEVAELQRIAEIHEKIMQIFPHASRQESFAAMLTYKIPKEDVKSLSEAFSQLEEAKHEFVIEEYSFSQSTLEQVFMEFAKEQESGDEDYKTIDTSFRWQQLQQNDLDPIHAVVLPT
ncbi:ATP-binding cassette sub-family A member 5 [Callorhinchus milii]|uniref:ATP-binding cassette sub-family A member 5 n=1 Tax=Callorhinchus milii TaxID=7868 RepID=UPI001C3FF485|nr:ATP-binding cassette sub-family A member 5 [Callorhinchus milii]